MTAKTACFACFFLLAVLSPATAREWKDATGKYAVEAELIAFTDEQVVLKRTDGKLVTMEMNQISKADKEFLKSRETAHFTDTSEVQTWTMNGGWKIVGRLVGYGRRDIVIQRRRGKIYVNDRLFDNLPEVYQRMLPRVVGHFEKVELADAHALKDWVLKQKGNPREFTVDGVLLEFENGDEYIVPFMFFSNNDLQVLQSGWDRWLASQEDSRRQQHEDFMLQAQARAYHRDRRVNQQVATMQLMLSAVDAGVTDLWEVYLEPAGGFRAPPKFVVVPARNSQGATAAAIARNPNYMVGGVRKLN